MTRELSERERAGKAEDDMEKGFLDTAVLLNN